MNIQKRLRVSYILMLFIPIFLIILSVGFMSRLYSDNDQNKAVFPPEFLTRIYSTMTDSPEQFLDEDFLVELDRLSGYPGKTNIFIEKENRIINSLNNSHGGRKPNRHGEYDSIQYWDFYFSDGSPGYMTINIFDKTLIRNLFISSSVSFLLVVCALMVTNALLSYFVARSIIKPIRILKEAALNIKNEELDSPVIYSGKDEFLDVCQAFEEMRIRLRDSLREQIKYEENRKELLSNISHDLKTPITAIKGYIEGIRDGIADSPEKVNKYIDTVYAKSVLMNDLIDRLFLFSKLDLNRIQFNFQTIDVLSFLYDTCEELKYDYPGLTIHFETEEKPPVLVSADSVHLHRVLMNLIDNAVKYTGDRKPVVIVRISQIDNMVTIEVEDNGRGIREEYLPHIFERFYRTDKARSSMTEGSGLGLSISKQIITAHGGEIKGRSTPGKGTAIIFTLRNAK